MQRIKFFMRDCAIHGNSPTPLGAGCIWCYRNELEQQVHDLTAERDSLEYQVSNEQQFVSELESERDELASEVEDLKNQIFEYEMRPYDEQLIHDLEEEVARQRYEIELLESPNQTPTGDVNCQDMLTLAQNEVARLQKQVRRHYEMLAAAQKRLGPTYIRSFIERDDKREDES